MFRQKMMESFVRLLFIPEEDLMKLEKSYEYYSMSNHTLSNYFNSWIAL